MTEGSGYARQENARAFSTAQPAASAEVAQRFDQYAQQSRFVNGRAFYQNGDHWVDGRVQQMANARRVQVKFNSDDYFNLMAQHREAAQWLSVARHVQFVLGDTVYEVVD